MTKQDIDEKKKYLRSYKWFEERIRNFEQQLKQLEMDEMNPKAGLGSGMPRSGNKKDLSDYMASKDKLVSNIIKTKSEMYRRKAEIIEAINELPAEFAVILELRFICGKSIEQIAIEKHYSQSEMYDKQRKALRMFVIPGRENDRRTKRD